MSLDVREITPRMRKFLLSVPTCYRSVCNHPFLLGLTLFLFLLHRTFPFVSSLLVSSAPIIVCTAVLLGALLSFGPPNPEKNREKISEISSAIAVRDGHSSTERFLSKNRDRVQKENEEIHFTEKNVESAVACTKDEQNNFMDLGTCEMERNRRLGNLILRRRMRKSVRMRSMADNNLIDLECTGISQIEPISTARCHPFEDLGFLASPGSAPSVLLQGRNPFDLPYESNEEKPDLSGDTFQQEFMQLDQKDKLLRKHESFNLGHSLSKLKPCFVPETCFREGSFLPLQRQSSKLSDSKQSSFTEIGSTLSTAVKSSSDMGENIPSTYDHEQLQETRRSP